MQRPRFALLLLCAVLAATAATAAAGDDDAEKTLLTPLRNGIDRIGAHLKIPTGAKILPTLPTGLKLRKPKLPQLPTGLELLRLPQLPTGLKLHKHKLPTGFSLPKPRLPQLPTGLKLPLHGKKHFGRRRLSNTVTIAKFALPTGPKFIPTGPKVIPTGLKQKIPFSDLSVAVGSGRRLQGLKKILPTGPIFVLPTGPKFVIPTIPTGPKFTIPTIPTGLKQKLPFTGGLGAGTGGGRRLHTLKGLKKIIPTGPLFALPTGLKKKLPGKLGRRMN